MDLTALKPGRGSTGCFSRCQVSPSLALRVLFMPVMTYPTCPVRSCCVAAGSGVSSPTWQTLNCEYIMPNMHFVCQSVL